MTNISNLSKVFQTKHLADLAKELNRPGITDFQKCALLLKAQPFLESSRMKGKSAQTRELLSLVTFRGQAEGYSPSYQTSFYTQVSGLVLNDIKPERIESVSHAYNKLKRRQERNFSQTAKSIKELIEKSPYKSHYAQAEIILENTKKFVSQRMRTKFRLKVFNGSDEVFCMCKFLWRYASTEYKKSIRKGEISPPKAFRSLKALIEFPMTVNEFKKLLMEKKSPKIEPKAKVKVPIPVRCLFRFEE